VKGVKIGEKNASVAYGSIWHMTPSATSVEEPYRTLWKEKLFSYEQKRSRSQLGSRGAAICGSFSSVPCSSGEALAKEPCQRNPKCNDILAATSFALYINLGCKMYHGFFKCFMSSQLDPRTKKSHYVGPQSTTNSHLGS